MENTRLELPAGIHTFETIRTDGCVYVDKTEYLVELIKRGKRYFLSRPRRFGKSLTVTTFNALFSGRKDLFKGLYAEEFLNSPEFMPRPVIRLDMSDITTNLGIDKMELSLKLHTSGVAQKLNVDIPENIPSGDMLTKLIVNTAKKYGTKVVVLIDEYDKPFTDFIDKPPMAEEVRTLLRNYYSRLKANEKYIHFIFITGIAKFTRMGVFSTLNNLIDISPMEKYGKICGLTEEEIVEYFPDYLEETAQKFKISTEELLERMRNYYNGFCFDIEGKYRLYNPFSTLNFFTHQVFTNFWFESATPSMIAKYLKTQKLTVEQFRNFPVSQDFIFNSVEIEKALPENFLFQTGYLSLRKGEGEKLFLDYPNTEVLNSMSALVSENILQDNDYNKRKILHALSTGNYDLVKEALNVLLASIPYDDFVNAAKENILINDYKYPAHEWLYRSTIFAFLRGCNIVVYAEMHSNLGRADLVVIHEGKTWIIEIKVAYKGKKTKKKAKEALQQIIDKNYAKPYPNAICMGLVIDDRVGQITEFKVKI